MLRCASLRAEAAACGVDRWATFRCEHIAHARWHARSHHTVRESVSVVRLRTRPTACSPLPPPITALQANTWEVGAGDWTRARCGNARECGWWRRNKAGAAAEAWRRPNRRRCGGVIAPGCGAFTATACVRHTRRGIIVVRAHATDSPPPFPQPLSSQLSRWPRGGVACAGTRRDWRACSITGRGLRGVNMREGGTRRAQCVCGACRL
jgi:hypothetical protein